MKRGYFAWWSQQLQQQQFSSLAGSAWPQRLGLVRGSVANGRAVFADPQSLRCCRWLMRLLYARRPPWVRRGAGESRLEMMVMMFSLLLF